MKKSVLKDILKEHAKYLVHPETGTKANLMDADLTEACLMYENLSGADLSGANLSRAALKGANLEGATLKGANLTRADLRGAVLVGAVLSWANLREANLRDANLTRADLRGADFTGADLTGADFTGADLTGADLTVADLSDAVLRDANLSGAVLSDANLSGATGLLDPVKWMEDNFVCDNLGYIVYKAIGRGTPYTAPSGWIIEPGAFIDEVPNPSRTTPCGCGVNFGTINWIKYNITKVDDYTVWKCRIRLVDLLGVVVPYNTDGKARCGRLELLEQVQ